MKKYHYVYATTNLINKKQYIGDHSTNNLNDSYLGSGRPYFKNALKKYGRKNFEKEILEFFNTKEEAFNAQKIWIKKYNTLSPNGYNISKDGGYGVIGCTLSKETKNKIKESISNLSEEWNKNIGNAQRGKKRGPMSEEHKRKIGNANRGKKWSEQQKEKNKHLYQGKNNGMIGKKHSTESKKKISSSKKGVSNGPFSEDHKKKIAKSLTGNRNPMKGKKMSDESRKKISESVKKSLEKKRQEKLASLPQYSI